jgi:hypothetical protein
MIVTLSASADGTVTAALVVMPAAECSFDERRAMRRVGRVVPVYLGGLGVGMAHPLLDRAQRRSGCGHRHRAALVGLGRVHLAAREVVRDSNARGVDVDVELLQSEQLALA